MEKEIVEYHIVVSGHLDFLEDVRKAIADGWQPIGGITYISGAGYAQAMVKYKKQ